MCTAGGYGDADVASFAVDIVLAQALATAANATVIAMIDTFRAVIVPELALGAVVVCRVNATVGACGAGGLRGIAEHA